MSDGVSIRRATAADIHMLAHHRAGMFRDMGVLEEVGYQPMFDAARTYFELAVPAGEYVAWLAAPRDEPQTIVAGAGVHLRSMLPRPRPGTAEIELGPEVLVMNVFTEVPWRRRGVAELLMQHVLAFAHEHGLHRILLHASPQGRSLYERMGFVGTNEMRFVEG